MIETTLMFQPNPLNTHNLRNPSQVHFKTCVIPTVDHNKSYPRASSGVQLDAGVRQLQYTCSVGVVQGVFLMYNFN